MPCELPTMAAGQARGQPLEPQSHRPPRQRRRKRCGKKIIEGKTNNKRPDANTLQQYAWRVEERDGGEGSTWRRAATPSGLECSALRACSRLAHLAWAAREARFATSIAACRLCTLNTPCELSPLSLLSVFCASLDAPPPYFLAQKRLSGGSGQTSPA